MNLEVKLQIVDNQLNNGGDGGKLKSIKVYALSRIQPSTLFVGRLKSKFKRFLKG